MGYQTISAGHIIYSSLLCLLFFNLVNNSKGFGDVIDIVEKYRDKSLPSCSPNFHPWVYDSSFKDDRVTFSIYENICESDCRPDPRPFVIFGNYRKPTVCDALLVCNLTYCLSISPEANKFVYTLPTKCANIKPKDKFEVFLTPNRTNDYINNTIFHYYDTMIKFDPSTKSELYGIRPTLSDKLEKSVSGECSADMLQELYIEGYGPLPRVCQSFLICNQKHCFAFTKTALANAVIFRRNIEFDMFGMNLPPPCHVVDIHTVSKRHALRNREENGRQGFGILRFNIPGYRYCGPGKSLTLSLIDFYESDSSFMNLYLYVCLSSCRNGFRTNGRCWRTN